MSETANQPMTLEEMRELLRSMYGGENKQITDGNFDA